MKNKTGRQKNHTFSLTANTQPTIPTVGQVDVMYSDLEKAFDKVPHKRLISKSYRYGINEYVINWIKDFLTERKFRVTVNLSNSPWNLVSSGIPQGSVLGPILLGI